MKTTTMILMFLVAVTVAFAQQTANELPACDCPDCREKAASGETGFSLPGLEELNEEETMHDHDAGEHAHAAVRQDDHEQHDHAEDHDHVHGGDEAALPAEHDHGSDEALKIDNVMAQEAGLRVSEAESGIIAKHSVFPAEIKLNRDQTAAVSPRYASVVRQVFAEIGDEVSKGDVLASLENRETLAVYTVSAPLDGTIISKDLAVGETAGADKVLYEVADLSTVWADISIFPKYQHLISKGMPVEFIAHDGHTARGAVKYISPIVSHETRTFTARCILKEPDEDFTPGAFVRARIYTQEVEVPVRVELEAVQTVDGETVVFVPDAHGFSPVDVETGLANDRYVEIRHGLKAGERYVSSGAFTLKAELIISGMDPHAGHSH